MFSISLNKKTYYPYWKKESNETIIESIPAGFYKFKTVSAGPFGGEIPMFDVWTIPQNIVEVKSDLFKSIENNILNHFSSKTTKVYKDLKIKNQLSCLFYGPPGTGKTIFSIYLSKLLVEQMNAIVLKFDNDFPVEKLEDVIQLIRGNKDNRIVVIILDEFDKFIGQTQQTVGTTFMSLNYNYNSILDYFDGSCTMNNILYLMTTNHFDLIPDALTDRPSRIKICQEIKYIPVEVATKLVDNLIPDKYKKKIDLHKFIWLIGENPIKIDQIKHIALDLITSNDDMKTVIERICKINVKEEKSKINEI